MTTETLLTDDVLKSSFKTGQELPVMNEVGSELVLLKGQEEIVLTDLVDLIESDPVISAKIISYAASPFFAYQGKLESVQEAIHHVLGIDMSMNVALSIAVGKQFNGPIKGPVGAFSVWSHSVYCAVLSQSIASKITNQQGLNPKTAYLYGLLHNIGFLALGHMFSNEFSTFNKTVEAKTETTVRILEKQVLGVTHTSAGNLLMKSWSMPDEFRIIMKTHHNSEYTGPHQVYSHIGYLANALLKSVDVGDASSAILPIHLLEEYNLTEDQLKDMLKIVFAWQENIDHLAQQLVA